jgi:hypothetical protein
MLLRQTTLMNRNRSSFTASVDKMATRLPAEEDVLRSPRVIHLLAFALVGLLVSTAVLVDVPAIGAQQNAKPKKKNTTIVGRVAAKVWDAHLNMENHSESFTVFVISLESKGHNKQPDKFVQVRYIYSSDKQSLPDSFFDYAIRYRFRVVRDPSCDEFVRDIRDPESGKFSGLAAELSPARNAPDTLWNPRLPLDCYLLSPGKYKPQK